MSEGAGEKRMKLRYAGVCLVCDADLPARVEAIYERTTKTVRCLDCSIDPNPLVEEGAPRPSRDPSPPLVEEGAPRPSRNQDPIDPGTPGASARREYERRQAKREARVREKHPKLGGLIRAVTDDPQSTKSWDTGAVGEERLGQKLNELASDTIRILHDRRIPGTRANIDHIAVAPSGVYVIDPKRYTGRPTLKVEGGLLRPRTEKLLVGGRDRTTLVDGVFKQLDLVRAIVGKGVPVARTTSGLPSVGTFFADRSRCNERRHPLTCSAVRTILTDSAKPRTADRARTTERAFASDERGTHARCTTRRTGDARSAPRAQQR